MSPILYLAALTATIGCSKEDPEVKYAAMMKKAADYVKAEKFEEARITIQSAIDIKPQEANAYYELAEIMIRLQSPRKALENYQSALNYDPKHRNARYHLAALFLAAKQYEQAEDQTKKLLEANPKDEDALVLKANIEAASPRKNYAESKKILDDILKTNPNNASAIASLASLALVENKLSEAETLFLQAIKLEPNSAPLQMVLAELYARQGRLDDAQEIVETLVKGNPKNTSLRFGLGDFLQKRGLSEKALEEYEEILKNDPLRHDARDRLYDIYVASRQSEKAKQLTADLVKINPDNPGVAYFQGRDAELANKPKEALDLFIKALAGFNNYAPIFRHAGLLELAMDNKRDGIEHLNQAIAIDPGDVGARLALAREAMGKKELAQATEHLNHVLRRYPQQVAANVLRADIALVQGDIDQARKVYQLLIDNFPKSPTGYYKLALLEEHAKNDSVALELFRKTLSFDQAVLIPAQKLAAILSNKFGVETAIKEITKLHEASADSKPEYKLILGMLAVTNKADPNRTETARKLFTEAVEGRAQLLGAYFALAALDSQKGDLEAAAKNYEKLIAKNTKHIPSYMLLALLKERQGKYQEAANKYRDLLKISPRFGPAANNLAWLLAEQLNGDLDEALKLAEIAKEQLPKEPSVADTLGWVHFKRGGFRAALPFIEEAIELEKKAHPGAQVNPEIQYHLAEVKFALDAKEEAKKIAESALSELDEKNPTKERIKKLLSKIQN